MTTTTEKPTSIDWRNLPPVPVDERPAMREDFRPSQTFLKHHDRCDRAAMLYLKYRAGSGGHALNRGAIFHDVVAQLTREMLRPLDGSEPASKLESPEVAKEVLAAYMSEHPEIQVPARERDDLRWMVTNWALGEYIVPEKVLAVETTFTLDLGGFTIIGRIDRADLFEPGTIEVIDYKTSFAMPGEEEFASQTFRDDGSPRFGGNFQTMLYALALAFGVFEGGYVLGEGFERFKLTLRFPRYLRPDGLGTRTATVTRAQLLDFKVDVETQLQRLREVNFGEGRWQPTPGSHCTECPAEYACPLPWQLRADSKEADSSLADLEAMAVKTVFAEKRLRDMKKRMKARAETLAEEDPTVLDLGNGDRGIRAGRDLAFLFIPYEQEAVKDKAALAAAVERAQTYGEHFDMADHVRRSEGVKFDKRKVAPATDRSSTE